MKNAHISFIGAIRRATGPVLPLLLALALCVAGCVSVDPLTVRTIERNRQVWEEDRRADLDPELVESRVREFDAQLRYENSK